MLYEKINTKYTERENLYQRRGAMPLDARSLMYRQTDELTVVVVVVVVFIQSCGHKTK